MKVLYDFQAYDLQTHGGVSRCMYELYKNLPSNVEKEISVLETKNVYLKEEGIPSSLYDKFISRKNFPLKRFLYKLYYNIKYNKCRKLDVWPKVNRFYSKKRIKKGDFDIFHPTFFDAYFLRALGKKPFVLIIHDMIPELYPQYYSRNDFQINMRKILVHRAAHIVAVSENTKKDVMRLYNLPEEKITVIYHGADETPYIPYKNPDFDFSYILYVGDRNFYKNFVNFILASLPVLKKHPELKIVCTGRQFTPEERFFFNALGIAHRIKHIFVTDDSQFLDLYHNAVAFVYPSEYEGFGIPILEAYKAGCPVMLNNASCFPEIAGDAAIYFYMNKDESNFAEKFEELYSMSQEERKELLNKQYERLKKFSWKKSAEQLAEVYKSIISKS